MRRIAAINRPCRVFRGAFVLIVLLIGHLRAFAQPRQADAGQAVSAVHPQDLAADPLRDPAEQRFPGCAALKTDPEQQRLLKQADQYLADGRPELAVVLWQKVLDGAGDTLVIRQIVEPLGPASTPLMIYGSLSEQVERTLAGLPPAALETYRTSADAEARALLAAAASTGEEDALTEVVRRFFVSSNGDDAAYKMACLALDRHDFAAADRLLNKVLTSYPDPSVAKGDMLLRLAIAAAHLQDRETAEGALGQLSILGESRSSAALVGQIAAEVKNVLARDTGRVPAASRDWHMALGNAARTGHMAALPAAATGGTLSELWVREFPIPIAAPGGSRFDSPPAADFPGRRLAVSQALSTAPRDELVARWRTAGWWPTGQLLFDDDRVYLKTPQRLLCFNAQAPRNQPMWQSAWDNHYVLDAATQQMLMLATSLAGSAPAQLPPRPRALAEVLLFGDRVHQSLAIADGVVYSLEGQRLTRAEEPQPVRSFQWGATPRRSRSNWLTAYQAGGGRALWTRTASDDDQTGGADIGFLAAPTALTNMLMAPVTEGGTIWLLGMDRTTGKTIWKTYLCDEPQSGAPPWAEPVVAIDGHEAYLACGCGLVFAVDALGGAIRWTVRYARDGKPNAVLRSMYGSSPNMAQDFSGWTDDVVIPYGRTLIVMPSDSDRILALDRYTGARVWESPRTSPAGHAASYCLGVNGHGLFVAGKNVIRRYDLLTGQLVREKEIESSFGRGCLTADAVYVPLRDSILKLDLELKDEFAHVDVALTSDEPIGSLFSDGEKLWVVGAGRVYALTTLDERLAALAKQIEAGDAEAQLMRMRLYFKRSECELALADLRGAYQLLKLQRPPDEAAKRLFAAIDQERLAQAEPLVVLPLLTDLFVTTAPPPRLGPEAGARLNDLVAACLSAIRQQKPARAVAAILAAAPLFTEEYLLTAATFAIDAVATEDDVTRLIDALDGPLAAAQLGSVRAAVRLAPDKAKTVLAKRLDSGDDRVRLAAARAFANLGERNGVLETLVSLLDSSTIQIRSRSHGSLQALTGQQFPFAPEGSAADRAATMKAWRQWIATSAATAKLNLPLADKAAQLGRILVAAPGALIELDADFKERWRTRLSGAAWGCQGLPNGHRLVAVNSHSMVVEYDDAGREVWKKDRLPAPPTSVERLDSGNTLIACAAARQIVEVAPDGSITAIFASGQPILAQRLDNGNTLAVLQQPDSRVVELTAAGQVIWDARTSGLVPTHAVRLPGGNTLVTLTQARKVVEYDAAGKTIVWESTPAALIAPSAAQRLTNGNTLVADLTGLREIDPSGKQVRWYRQQQVTGLSVY